MTAPLRLGPTLRVSFEARVRLLRRPAKEAQLELSVYGEIHQWLLHGRAKMGGVDG